jgi:hypothetical protein
MAIVASLITRLPGPFFDFLVVNEEEIWERRGRVQRVVGIKQEYFHHPEALRVPDSVVGIVVIAFKRSHPEFYFWGPTVYRGEELDRLIAELRAQEDTIRACPWKREFALLLPPLFTHDCRESIGPLAAALATDPG